MPNSDKLFVDQSIPPLSFYPRTRDRGSNIRESVLGLSDNSGNQIDPAQDETVAAIVTALQSILQVVIKQGGNPLSVSNRLPVEIDRQVVTYTTSFSGALTGAWTKVATVISTTRALRIDYTGSATSYAVEWIAFPAGTYANDAALAAAVAGSTAPATGAAIGGGEDWQGGLPFGDVYARDAANVSTAVLVQAGA